MSNLFADNELHLTVIDSELETKRARTVAGMVHFAGTGPTGATCRECSFWTNCGKQSGYAARRGMGGGEIKPRACAKFKSLMAGMVGAAVRHDIAACKYFERATVVPSAFEKSA